MLWILAACVTLGVSGCANLTAVKSYATQTRKLTSAFEPMVAGSIASCESRYVRKALYTDVAYDVAIAARTAKQRCAPIGRASDAASDLNALLAEYADTLGALADGKLPSYKAELGALSKSVIALKGADGDPLLDRKQVGAVTALTEFLTRAATQQVQLNALHDALRQHESVATIADALEQYAQRNYGGYLRDEIGDFDAIEVAVRDRAQSEPLASRYLATRLAADRSEVLARHKAADQYVAALRRMVATHRDLADNLDRLDAPERFQLLMEYAEEVYALQKQLAAAF